MFTRRATLTGRPLALSSVSGRASLQTLLDEPDYAIASFLLYHYADPKGEDFPLDTLGRRVWNEVLCSDNLIPAARRRNPRGTPTPHTSAARQDVEAHSLEVVGESGIAARHHE